MQKAAEFFQKESAIWGPLFLIFSVILAAKTSIHFDLLLTAAVGFFLCMRLVFLGFFYALIILVITAIFKHTFFTCDHFWNLGIEISFALGFLITALVKERSIFLQQTMEFQLEEEKNSCTNLKKDLNQLCEKTKEQQTAFQEKIANLQKELEETRVECSSILILNEVLRKKVIEYQNRFKEAFLKRLQAQNQLQALKESLDFLEKKLKALSVTDEMAAMNQQLMRELNEIRFEKEQTALINEALLRQHLILRLQAKEDREETLSYKSLLKTAHRKVFEIRAPLEEKISELQAEKKSLSLEFEKTCCQTDDQALNFEKLNQERHFLQERLKTALAEIEHLQKHCPKRYAMLEKEFCDLQQKEKIAKEHVVELAKQLQDLKAKNVAGDETKLKVVQKKMTQLVQVEPLYKQLKKQFEQKNKILEKTRKQLFETDTKLQALLIEKSSINLSSFPKEVEEEIQKCSNHLQTLDLENQQLHEIITHLTEHLGGARENPYPSNGN